MCYGANSYLYSPERTWIEGVLRDEVNPALCVVGVIGNSMNVVVMTRRRVRSALDSRMERAARVGLLSLTIADILCCVASLIVAVGAVERALFQSRDMLRMLIVAYGPYAQNALAKTSTWLVVVTAVGRYVAICRPLEARQVAAGPRNTGLAVAGAFVGSAMIELPTAWEYSITRFDCADTYYLLDQLPAA